MEFGETPGNPDEMEEEEKLDPLEQFVLDFSNTLVYPNVQARITAMEENRQVYYNEIYNSALKRAAIFQDRKHELAMAF